MPETRYSAEELAVLLKQPLHAVEAAVAALSSAIRDVTEPPALGSRRADDDEGGRRDA